MYFVKSAKRYFEKVLDMCLKSAKLIDTLK